MVNKVGTYEKILVDGSEGPPSGEGHGQEYVSLRIQKCLTFWTHKCLLIWGYIFDIFLILFTSCLIALTCGLL